MAAYSNRRHVVAVDAPGYGESDGPKTPVPIAAYASAIAEVLPYGVFDIFRYHTGVVFALELAIQNPDNVKSLTLMGVPYFPALDFEAWKARLAKAHQLMDDLAQFEERWQSLVTDRPTGMSLKRAFRNFIDELKAWPNGYWAHKWVKYIPAPEFPLAVRSKNSNSLNRCSLFLPRIFLRTVTPAQSTIEFQPGGERSGEEEG